MATISNWTSAADPASIVDETINTLRSVAT